MGTRKVLIADDEPHVVHVMRHRLRAAGCDVRAARDGQEALEMAMQDRPAVLLTDNWMPGPSGLELCRKLQEQPATAGIPTIMLTARDFEVSDMEIVRTAILQVIGKPFSPGRVAAAVLDLLARHFPRLVTSSGNPRAGGAV